MRDLLHHVYGVDPVAADKASRVGDEAADVPGKKHSLHGQDNCTDTTHHQQVTKHYCDQIKSYLRHYTDDKKVDQKSS